MAFLWRAVEVEEQQPLINEHRTNNGNGAILRRFGSISATTSSSEYPVNAPADGCDEAHSGVSPYSINSAPTIEQSGNTASNVAVRASSASPTGRVSSSSSHDSTRNRGNDSDQSNNSQDSNNNSATIPRRRWFALPLGTSDGSRCERIWKGCRTSWRVLMRFKWIIISIFLSAGLLRLAIYLYQTSSPTQTVIVGSGLYFIVCAFRIYTYARRNRDLTSNHQTTRSRQISRSQGLFPSRYNRINYQHFALLAEDRDFTDADYERLLALDENTPTQILQRATSTEVNRLPTYTFKTKANETLSAIGPGESETKFKCTICLSDFETGETLRILPCFHQFHINCIDPWLTQGKAECPVCKNSIR